MAKALKIGLGMLLGSCAVSAWAQQKSAHSSGAATQPANSTNSNSSWKSDAAAPDPTAAVKNNQELSSRCKGKVAQEKAPGAIDAICKNYRKISKVHSLAELESSICSIAADQSDQFKRSDLAVNALSKIEALKKNDPDKGLADSSLRGDLDTLTDYLNSLPNAHTLSAPASELGNQLAAVIAKWKDPAARESNADAYYQDVFKILGQTDEGKKVIACYQKKPAGFGADAITMVAAKDIKKRPELSYIDMQFSVRDDGKSAPHREIMFNTSLPPSDAISLLGHEMYHGCSAEPRADLNRKMLAAFKVADKNRGSDQANSDYFDTVRNNDIYGLNQETGTYQTQAKIYSDLAKARPAEMCAGRFVSRLAGTQILSSGEYNAFIENSANDGTLPLTIAEHYGSSGQWQPEAIFVHNAEGVMQRDPNTHQPMLYPDVTDDLKSHGFKVKEAKH